MYGGDQEKDTKQKIAAHVYPATKTLSTHSPHNSVHTCDSGVEKLKACEYRQDADNGKPNLHIICEEPGDAVSQRRKQNHVQQAGGKGQHHGDLDAYLRRTRQACTDEVCETSTSCYANQEGDLKC